MSVEVDRRRIAAVDDSITDTDDIDQQYEMYRRTLTALEAIDADDNDDGGTVVTDWIIDRIETTGAQPSSKAVRQRAAEFCRTSGFEIPDDSWLGR